MRLSLQLLLFLSIVINTNIVNNAEGALDDVKEPVSFGQKNLSAILEMSGGFDGKIFLQDFGGRHEKLMLLILTQFVPNQAVVTAEKITKSAWEPKIFADQLKQHSVRVMHAPNGGHIFGKTEALESMSQVMKDTDVLLVRGTGNSILYPHDDIFQPEDPFWGFRDDDPLSPDKEYHQLKAIFQGGHVVMASYAVKKPATFEEFASLIPRSIIDRMGGIGVLRKRYQNADIYIRHPNLLRFGDMKEYGFTVDLLEYRGIYVNDPDFFVIVPPSASAASAHLSAFAFYLFQLWDTTAEVVEVMQKTAIDIGEPGPDEEFGWGLINADHPIIWNKSIERLQQSLSFCLLEDIALEDAVTTIASEGLDLFYDVDSNKREIGLTYNRNKTALALTTGSAAGLFGLSSRFLEKQQNSFVQCGLRYSFTKNTSLVGVFGHSEQEDVRIHKGSLGVSYQSHFSEKGNLMLYAGYRTIWGTLGLPGHEIVNAKKVPFALHMPELRAALNWSF